LRSIKHFTGGKGRLATNFIYHAHHRENRTLKEGKVVKEKRKRRREGGSRGNGGHKVRGEISNPEMINEIS